MNISAILHNNKQISCIICAFNEGPRIASVLEIATTHPLINEVIVVDDGSTDETSEVVRSFPSVKLISYIVNQGKSHAMATGAAEAKYDLLMLLDADLKGLKYEHITALAIPVLSGNADISLSLRRNSLWIYRVIGLDFVSGERVLNKELLCGSLKEVFDLPRFGIEVYINSQIITRRLSIAVASWPHVTQSRKTEKLGYWKGVLAEWRMISDLFKVSYPYVLILQTYQMLKLRTHFADVKVSIENVVIPRENTP